MYWFFTGIRSSCSYNRDLGLIICKPTYVLKWYQAESFAHCHLASRCHVLQYQMLTCAKVCHHCSNLAVTTTSIGHQILDFSHQLNFSTGTDCSSNTRICFVQMLPYYLILCKVFQNNCANLQLMRSLWCRAEGWNTWRFFKVIIICQTQLNLPPCFSFKDSTDGLKCDFTTRMFLIHRFQITGGTEPILFVEILHNSLHHLWHLLTKAAQQQNVAAMQLPYNNFWCRGLPQPALQPTGGQLVQPV